MRILLIIPAYNEEASIEGVVEKIRREYPQYEYVVVNDGSSDRTGEICHRRGYRVIDHPINLGLAGALQTGMQYAWIHHYDAAIQFDADGQHRPEYIAAMAQEMEKGDWDVVIGSRFVSEKKPMTGRMIGSRLLTGAIRMTTGQTIQDPTSGMRLYGKRVMPAFAENLNFGPEPNTISYLLKKGFRVTEVQVTMQERQAGHSYLSFSKSVFYMMNMLISILVIQRFRE